ncbi:MAG: glutamate--tRNA ligase [Candidatus Gracilibacteria bacterium]|nr:glutamate--tRNA ligase [Candidatus Gracilibacteria bacterium]MDD2908315.1 glutamate--tRNA ligase [Candidatus Gracilibacteria bacterium]
MIIKTRLAPSPTGFVHIGSLRLALYDYLFAKKNNGIYALRVEDTDQTRSVEGTYENMVKVFEEVGIIPNEGPSPYKDLGNGPYIQSERLPLYRPFIDKMIEEGNAYYCFCTSERLTELRAEQESLKLPTKYDGLCRDLPLEDAKKRIEDGEKYVVRLKVPKGEKISFNDLVRGRVEFSSSEVDDQVLLKSDGFPTYHGAVVIDDYLMKVTHAFRGVEWLSSMPKQILVAKFLKIELPEYAHLPLIVDINRKKLSKRSGDVAVEEYLKKGYLKEALLNFILFLGWNPKTTEEIFSLEEMVERFDIKDVHKSDAVFDIEKLNWMNGQYIIKTPIDELFAKLEKYLSTYEVDFYNNVFIKHNDEYNKRILTELKTRMKKFDEYIELTTFIYNDSKINTSLLLNEKMGITTLELAKTTLIIALDIINSQEEYNAENIKNMFIEKIKEAGLKNGQVLWPVRVALSGELFSPGAFELIGILGPEKSSERIQKIIDEIEKI